MLVQTKGSAAGLGRALRARRRALALSQQNLADLANVSLRFLHEAEHGKPTVRLDKLLAVLHALGVHLELAPGASAVVEVPGRAVSSR